MIVAEQSEVFTKRQGLCLNPGTFGFSSIICSVPRRLPTGRWHEGNARHT